MLAASLEDRFRASLGPNADPWREESIRFAVAFARLVVRVLPDEVPPDAVSAVAKAVAARTDVYADEVDALIALALSPEHRTEVREDELVAFGARFGPAAERAMRAAVLDELDLEGFAARYGSSEALLLLDTLFSVCAVDGRIDPAEIARLQESAGRLQVDPMLVGLLFRKHDARHATGDMVFDLEGLDEVVIGRAAPAHVRLPDPQVAVAHASLVRTDRGWRVHDLESGRPTLFRGAPVRTAPLAPGDELRVGPYRLVLAGGGDQLVALGTSAVSALSVRELRRAMPGADGPEPLLDDVSFTVFSGEVIALVGPSGAGKTTLLHAIAGIAPPDTGHVLLDGADFHALLASDRSIVGIVPQDDVLHGELTVEESLWYAARLRLPADAGATAVQLAVERVLGQTGLAPIRGHRIGTPLARGVSGGQRKRVNLGQELVTSSTRVLFLDEPTSGLDPATAQDVVRQVRSLADDGRIVFLVTHDTSPSLLDLVDHVIVLAPGGRLAWFGPAREAATHFGVDSVDGVFARLPSEAPEVWADRYRRSPAFRKYVRTREHLLGLSPTPEIAPEPASSPRSWWVQTATLTARYARVRARDVLGTGVLLAQAPLLAGAFTLVFPHPDPATMFVLVLSSLWLGASASVRELIADRAIFRREARVGLRLVPYLASKVVVLSALVAVQCLTLVGLMYAGLHMADYGVDGGGLALVSVATGLTGMAMGLTVSAAFSSTEAAVGALPLVLIPQLAFGGLVVTVKDMGPVARLVSALMVTRYGFEAALDTADTLWKPSREGRGGASVRLREVLWDFGFGTSGADQHALSTATLASSFALFTAFFLLSATLLTSRSRRGN